MYIYNNRRDVGIQEIMAIIIDKEVKMESSERGMFMQDRTKGIKIVEKQLQQFYRVVKKYYPKKEIAIEKGSIWVDGYLAGLIRSLLRRECGDKFVFIKYLIEHVEYTEASEITETFISDLINIGIIYQDPKIKDMYRITDNGFKVLRKVRITERIFDRY